MGSTPTDISSSVGEDGLHSSFLKSVSMGDGVRVSWHHAGALDSQSRMPQR